MTTDLQQILKTVPWENGQTTNPGPTFWQAWKAHKEEMKALGVRVQPGADKAWIISWTAPASASSKPVAPKSATVSTAPETKPVCFIPTVSEAVSSKLASMDTIPWTDEQKKIFAFAAEGTGNLVVRARAGSGKTTTVSKAFEFVPAHIQTILYAAFMKKNQLDAAKKIQDPRVEVRTLHSVGNYIICRAWTGSRPDNEVESYRTKAICGNDTPDIVVNAIKKLVGFAKNIFIEPSHDDLMDLAEDRDVFAEGFESPQMGGWVTEKLADAAMGVLELSKTRDPQNRISFDDMVWLPVVMNWVRPMFDMVVVDEAQDMNWPQLTMCKRLVRRNGRCVVVGDDRQAIYGFRGAASNSIDIMKQELAAGELGLTVTQRNPKCVVALAQKYVPDFKAADKAIEGEVASIVEAKLPESVQVGDVVLSRSNAALMPPCLSVLRKGIRARIEGRDIGKALVSLVNGLKAKSVPDFLARVERWSVKMCKRHEGRKNAEDRMSAIRDQAETLLALAEGMASVNEIKARIESLFSDSETDTNPCVLFSSVHKAKGLEWDRVFVIRDTFLKRKVTEEENIYYVAITRARKQLVFVQADKAPVATDGTK